MKASWLGLSLVGVALLLTACSNDVFNVPQSSWDQMTPAQRQQTIINYYREQSYTEPSHHQISGRRVLPSATKAKQQGAAAVGQAMDQQQALAAARRAAQVKQAQIAAAKATMNTAQAKLQQAQASLNKQQAAYQQAQQRYGAAVSTYTKVTAAAAS